MLILLPTLRRFVVGFVCLSFAETKSRKPSFASSLSCATAIAWAIARSDAMRGGRTRCSSSRGGVSLPRFRDVGGGINGGGAVKIGVDVNSSRSSSMLDAIESCARIECEHNFTFLSTGRFRDNWDVRTLIMSPALDITGHHVLGQIGCSCTCASTFRATSEE